MSARILYSQRGSETHTVARCSTGTNTCTLADVGRDDQEWHMGKYQRSICKYDNDNDTKIDLLGHQQPSLTSCIDIIICNIIVVRKVSYVY